MSILEEHIPYALKQFKIDTIVPIEIFGVDASLTNVSSAKIATAIVVVSYLYYAMRDATLVPRRFQVSAEMIYGLISNTVVGVAGLEAKPAIPFVFTLFTFVLFGTLIGLTPLHVTFTSHLINTLALSFIVFAYANILGFGRHGFGFLRISARSAAVCRPRSCGCGNRFVSVSPYYSGFPTLCKHIRWPRHVEVVRRFLLHVGHGVWVHGRSRYYISASDHGGLVWIRGHDYLYTSVHFCAYHEHVPA